MRQDQELRPFLAFLPVTCGSASLCLLAGGSGGAPVWSGYVERRQAWPGESMLSGGEEAPKDSIPRSQSGFLLHRTGREGRRGFSRSKKSVGGCDTQTRGANKPGDACWELLNTE